MGLRSIAFHDRDVAGEPRFRRQQIVEVRIELVRRGVVADVKDLSLRVEEQLEVHPADFLICDRGEREQLRS